MMERIHFHVLVAIQIMVGTAAEFQESLALCLSKQIRHMKAATP